MGLQVFRLLSPSASSSTILKLLKDWSGGLKHIGGLKSAEENLGLFQETHSRVAAEVGRRSGDPCQVTQLQVEPTSFEPGEGAMRVFLIAIARKRGVAEVDLYVDGNCSCAILEPITVQDAALLQTDPSSNNLRCDCSKQVLVQYSGWKSLVTSPPLQTAVKSEGADLKGSECGRIKQEVRPRKRTACIMSVEECPHAKREKMVGGFNQKPNGAEEISHTKREAYSWTHYWRHILRRKSISSGRVQIENRYMRP